jgi:hypothetical protein
MMKKSSICVLAFFLLASASLAAQTEKTDWVRYARIAAYGLRDDNASEIVRQATKSNVLGIEVDNDITGRYESFLNPTEKLKAIRRVAIAAHKAGNRAFVYIAGTECITAHANVAQHTLAKDHPDWAQRDISGRRAIFYYGDAFWISKGDEDVWVSPYAPEWRRIYMQRVRQIAATGIDGIYIDVPYWMTHFKGWEKTWASFDDDTVAAFKKQTGLDARKDIKLGDFDDPGFRKWVEFRIQTMVDFLQEISRNAKSVNPHIAVIPEIYPGIEESTVRVGVDPYRIYPVVDAITHEYEFGSGDHTAAARTPLDWFLYQVGIASFRAFAGEKATWLINYSWDGNKKIDPREAMRDLAMSEVMAGANVWDAKGHVMDGSNDLPTRTEMFAWIRDHEDTLYHPRTPIHPVGVYFSPLSRDFHTDDFLSSYQGTLVLLMQAHLEYQIVTPRTLSGFRGKTLILPNVSILDDTEKAELQKFRSHGGNLAVTGTDATGFKDRAQIIRFPQRPGAAYLAALKADFSGTSLALERTFLQSLSTRESFRIIASSSVATQIASVDGDPHIFFANFKGLVSNQNAAQTPEIGAKIISDSPVRAFFLPFLGSVTELRATTENGKTVFVLPEIIKGAVVWLKPN